MGIEPTYSAWKAEVLPLNYTRRKRSRARDPLAGTTPGKTPRNLQQGSQNPVEKQA